MANNTWLWWSSGKDSAWALHTLRRDPEVNLTALVTTVNADADRVAMHAVRTELLRMQADALSLPLHLVELPYPCPDGAYETAAAELIAQAELAGVTHMAFGDLYLEHIRAFREDLLAESVIEPVFPLWGLDTKKLARDMVDGGIVARLTCVNPELLDGRFAGRMYDHALLDELPEDVDPCAEGGEFHTFVSDSPDFSAPLAVVDGEIVQRDGVYFADVLPEVE